MQVVNFIRLKTWTEYPRTVMLPEKISRKRKLGVNFELVMYKHNAQDLNITIYVGCNWGGYPALS